MTNNPELAFQVKAKEEIKHRGYKYKTYIDKEGRRRVKKAKFDKDVKKEDIIIGAWSGYSMMKESDIPPQGLLDKNAFVTKEGELLSSHGVFSGGRGSGNASASLLARKNEITDLKKELDGLSEIVSGRSKEKGDLQAEQSVLKAGLQQVQNELRQQEVSIATSEGELKALQNSQSVLAQKIEGVTFELNSLGDQESEGSGKRDQLATEMVSLEERERISGKNVDEVINVVDIIALINLILG